MDAKEGSSKQLESDDTVNTLKLTPQEIDELLAVRESVHSALEKSMKSTTACPDSETERSSTVEEGKNSLNLWLSNPTSPSATSDDAIQLSRTVILYVKVLTIHKNTKGGKGGSYRTVSNITRESQQLHIFANLLKILQLKWILIFCKGWSMPGVSSLIAPLSAVEQP